MKKLIGLLVAGVLGAGLTYFVMHNHVVRAEDGYHTIAKAEPTLSDAYVDVREFTLADWQAHASLVENIAESDDTELQATAIKNGVLKTAENVLKGALEGLSK